MNIKDVIQELLNGQFFSALFGVGAILPLSFFKAKEDKGTLVILGILYLLGAVVLFVSSFILHFLGTVIIIPLTLSVSAFFILIRAVFHHNRSYFIWCIFGLMLIGCIGTYFMPFAFFKITSYDSLNRSTSSSQAPSLSYPSYFHQGSATTTVVDPLSTNTRVANFSLEVQLTFHSNDACGGVFFREDNTFTNGYLFRICQDKTYALLKYTDYTGEILTHWPNTKEIHTGQQKNTIALVAEGNKIWLYVNTVQIACVQDQSNNYTNGGLVLLPLNVPPEVTYSNLKVWTLSRGGNERCV